MKLEILQIYCVAVILGILVTGCQTSYAPKVEMMPNVYRYKMLAQEAELVLNMEDLSAAFVIPAAMDFIPFPIEICPPTAHINCIKSEIFPLFAFPKRNQLKSLSWKKDGVEFVISGEISESDQRTRYLVIDTQIIESEESMFSRVYVFSYDKGLERIFYVDKQRPEKNTHFDEEWQLMFYSSLTAVEYGFGVNQDIVRVK